MLFDTLTLKLQTLTPLFLGGAEPRGSPELRASSVRGAIRYWLRAALGGAIGDNYRQVYDKESEVLGNTDTASGITVRLSQPSYTPEVYKKQGSTTYHRGKPQASGRDYLYWSMASTGSIERGNFQPAKQAIPVGTAIDVTLVSQFADDGSPTLFFQAAASLWLLTHLGGLGSRSRRTAGSLGIANANSPPSLLAGLDKLPNFHLSATTAETWAAQLGTGIKMIRTQFAPLSPLPTLHRPSHFDVLHPQVCDIWVLSGQGGGIWHTSEDAIKGIGEAMRDFRGYREPDHDNVRHWIEQRVKIPTVERAAFGLPLPFRYSNGGPADVVLGSNDHERRASPLCLRVSRLANGQYVGVAVLFHAEFLEAGEDLKLQRNKARTSPPKNYDLLRQFITNGFHAIPVKYS